jgi:hypothetical protein
MAAAFLLLPPFSSGRSPGSAAALRPAACSRWPEHRDEVDEPDLCDSRSSRGRDREFRPERIVTGDPRFFRQGPNVQDQHAGGCVWNRG